MWAQSAGEVGKIVSTARRYRKLTQAQLARAVGATQTWVSEIETGKDTAQIGKILRVLSYLGVRLQVGEAPWVARKGARQPVKGISLTDVIASHSSNGGRKAKP